MRTIDDFEISPYIPPKFSDDAWISLDIELFGLPKERMHRPEGKFASLAITQDGKEVYIITEVDGLKILQQILEDSDCGVIFQNGAFDIGHLRRWIDFPPRKKLWDTLLCDRILYNGYYNTFNLKALTRRHLHAYLEKDTVKEFEKATELDNDKIRYNARDAVVQWRIAQRQMKLFKDKHRKVWYEIDLPAMWSFLDFKGIKIDAEKWKDIAEDNKEKSDEKKKTFPMNPNAPAQVKAELHSRGIMVENTRAGTLEAHRKNPFVSDILEYRKVDKRRSTYGMSWLNRHIEEDGRVYTFYDVNKAETGRVASEKPCVHNLPVRDTPVYRQSVIADEGNVLVGGDFGQQEIRDAAYLSRDEKLIELLNSGRDIYAEIASIIHSKEIKKSDRERQDAKGVVLGAIYGLTAYGLAIKLTKERGEKVSEEDAQKLLDIFFGKFPQLAQWVEQQKKLVQRGYVFTPSGRVSYLNPYHRQAENNALNAPNQGGGADMIKRATVLLHERWNCDLEPFPAILQVHDELVLEVRRENEDYAKGILEACMINAGEYVIPGVKVAVDIRSGKSWYEVH